VVYGVVRQSGGHIRSKVNRRWNHILDLPAASGSPARDREGARHQGAIAASRVRNHSVRRGRSCHPALLSPFLKSLGYHVLSAPDGEAAWKWRSLTLAKFTCCSAICNAQSGRTRTRGQTQKLGSRQGEGVVHLRLCRPHGGGERPSTGGVGFLQKPFSMDLLAKTVRGILDGTLP